MKNRSMPAEPEKRLLCGATAWQRKPSVPQPIGLAIDGFLTKRKKHFQKAAAITERWRDLIPDEMQRHCTLAGLESGVLTIEVTPGPFLHKMQMMRSEILSQLRSRCPRSGLREIRIVPGRFNQENTRL